MDKKKLKQLAHHLKPVVTIGKLGLTDTVLAELDTSLIAHELLKVKLPEGSASEKKALIDSICQTLGAHFIQSIGRVVVLFRKKSVD
jgi:RNA-binding protein